MAAINETNTWHRADGSVAVFKVMERQGWTRMVHCNYETLTPKDGSADLVTVWDWMPNKKMLARADDWRRHYDRWSPNIRRMA